MSVLWPSKYAKIRFRLGLTTLPRPLSRLEREHPSPYATPLGTDPPSALAMRPPEVQPDLRLWFDASKHHVETACVANIRQHCYFAVNSSVTEELA